MARTKKPNQGLAIVALIINLFLLPGLGSIIAGRIKSGIWQLALHIGGIVMVVTGVIFMVTIFLFAVGIPLLILGFISIITAWIWALVTGIQLVQEASE